MKNLRIEDAPRPEISQDEVLVEVKAGGICGTDIHIYRGEWKTEMPLASNINEEDPVEYVKGLTDGYGVDVAIEAGGSPKAITQAMRVARRGVLI